MSSPLPVVAAEKLPENLRALLQPGKPFGKEKGAPLLPTYFYEVDSWATAKKTLLTVHFTLAELMSVDCREHPEVLQTFPHYVPCAVSVLARYLEEFRARVEAPVYVSVNGGYRSPAHAFSQKPSAHLFAVAADIYRIGETWIDHAKAHEKYSAIAQSIGQEVYLKPFGAGEGETDDHLHFELGYLHLAPRPPG